jgi:hypothetical protein
MDCLANGKWGGKTEVIFADTTSNLYVFARQGETSEVLVAVSFSKEQVQYNSNLDLSSFTDFVSEGVELNDGNFTIQPNGFIVLSNKK